MAQRNTKNTSTRGRGRPRKKPAASNSNSNSNNTNNKNNTARKTNNAKNLNAAENSNNSNSNSSLNSIALNIMPFILIIIAVYMLVSFFVNGAESVGFVGFISRNIFYGLLGAVAVLVPVFLGSIAVFLKKDKKSGFFKYRIIFSVICVILFAAIFHLAFLASGPADEKIAYTSPGKIFENGTKSIGGGVFGGYLAETLCKCVGLIGAWIFTLPLSIVFSTFLFGYTPAGFVKLIIKLIKEYKINSNPDKDKEGYERNIIVKTQDPERRFKSTTHKYKIKSHPNNISNSNSNVRNSNNRNFNPDIPIDSVDSHNNKKKSKNNGIIFGDNPFASSFAEETEAINANINNTQLNRSYETPIMLPESELFDSGSNNLNSDLDELFPAIDGDKNNINIDIKGDKDFDDADAITLENVKSIPQVRDDEPDVDENNKNNKTKNKPAKIINFETSKVFEEDDIPVKKEYKFPPITYLTKDTSTANEDIREELQETAQKLKDTLASFGVKTRICGYSRGPAITRYEIAPDAGVKVNSVVTLANDISLNLAADVRIEAPIPGKSAIGIEVPNKIRTIVHLRNLLEEQKFINAASKITIALGVDVAGDPVYSDIAKMPHLLIAGATGSGKSICTNSIIASILYKATPDEVRMILIDPKKVELNIYNGIPHLLVPVVSDPKKAAGALSWAVNQMEERYMLIEGKGVRDFKTYNEAIADDPLTEPLSQIVIIIDELADLMLTAKENVEQSVNRLAAKARAAGIHLIVATQRPSVDVITGLIKANIPTRMAFAVASQIDSKTIINMGGAEKLIGLGDMLYQPIGSKPLRVQGAFISDKDVLNIVEFWKKQSDGKYDENILSEIEQEALRCNTKGGKMQDRNEETNPDDEFRKDSMLKDAIEIAIDTGRISTSLLQTKLSLGYARAARIINTMEKMNLIGPFEGSKPRKVMITRQEYIEMTMNKDDFE